MPAVTSCAGPARRSRSRPARFSSRSHGRSARSHPSRRAARSSSSACSACVASVIRSAHGSGSSSGAFAGCSRARPRHRGDPGRLRSPRRERRRRAPTGRRRGLAVARSLAWWRGLVELLARDGERSGKARRAAALAELKHAADDSPARGERAAGSLARRGIRDDVAARRRPTSRLSFLGVAMKQAEILADYTFPSIERVHGVTHDGHDAWIAVGIDCSRSARRALGRALRVRAEAGSAFDGRHF